MKPFFRASHFKDALKNLEPGDTLIEKCAEIANEVLLNHAEKRSEVVYGSNGFWGKHPTPHDSQRAILLFKEDLKK
jgi:hypothetical protein